MFKTKKKKKIFKNKNFKPILNFLRKFNLKSFNDKKKVKEYSNFFELLNLIKEIREDKKSFKNPKFLRTVKVETKPHSYELDDLCRLHWIIMSRKVMTTLEFGSGFSTIFMADACLILSFYFKEQVIKYWYTFGTIAACTLLIPFIIMLYLDNYTIKYRQPLDDEYDKWNMSIYGIELD